ncbi:hypothetical protein T265_15963, partial [Opisthorchis viverrini]
MEQDQFSSGVRLINDKDSTRRRSAKLNPKSSSPDSPGFRAFRKLTTNRPTDVWSYKYIYLNTAYLKE